MKTGVLFLGLLLFLCSFTATAGPVSWTVNATFASGGTVTGSFVWNADTSSATNVSLLISGGPAPLLDGSLTNFGFTDGAIYSFDQSPADNNPGIWLNPTSQLSNAGGSITLGSLSLAGFCLDSNCDAITAMSSKGLDTLEVLSGTLLGTPVTSSVPEISTTPALLLGIVGLTMLKLRTSRHSAAS
jgi:hypothetical protein